MALVMVTTMLPTMALATAEGGSTNPPTPAVTETPEASEDDGNTESVYNNEEDSQPQSLMRAPMLTAEADDKRAYYQIIMKDGTAIKLYPGVTGGHCIRTNSSTEAEPGGETPDNYVVKLGSYYQTSGLYDWELYLKNFDGQSITYCDGEEGEPFQRDGMKIEVEGDNTLTAGAESLRNGVYTAIGRTIVNNQQDISFRLSNKYNIYGGSPARGSLTIKSDCSVPGMKRACGIACKDLEIAGSYEPAASMTLTVNLSGNSKGTDRAISVTNRFMITAYASMYLNVQGLNAVYNESKYLVNGTHTKPSDSDKNVFFLIDTHGTVIVNLDTMGLDGNITAFYNYYYQDQNYASHNHGLNELRKVGKMRVTVRNLHPDKLATARANPTSIWWVGTKPGWKTEWGNGLLLDELQADGTCVFEYAPVTPADIGKVILYDGETGGNTGNIRYRARAYKEYPPTDGATINAPVTAPKVGNDIPFKRWTTVDGAPLTFLSEDGATSNPAILQLQPKSTTKLLAMYDPFTSQPRWEPVFNKEKNRNDGRIRWVTGYGLEPTDSWLVPEDYSLKDDLNPIPVTDRRGAIVMDVKSGETLFSNDPDFRYSVPAGRYRIALRDGDSRWYYSDPFTIHYPLAQPQFTPEGGFVDSDTQTVAITAVEGAEIWYAVYDDTTQTSPAFRRYTEPLTIPVTTRQGTVVVEAYASKDGENSKKVQAKFSAKPAVPVVKLPDGTTAKSGDTYTYYDAADISAVAPDGVEIRYSANAPVDGALGRKLGKGETFTVSNGDGHVQITYLRARKTLQSGDQTYTAWSDLFMLNMVRVADLPDPIVKVGGKVMDEGSTYTVNGSAEVTLTRPEYCPVDAKLVYTKDSAIPSYCVEYTKPITISNQATKLDVYMRARNSETNKYDASPGGIYHFTIKPGTTAWKLFLTDATAYDSSGNVIERAVSGTVVTVRANPYSESGYGVFRSWEGGGTQYLENEKVDTYQPEVTFVMPDKAVRLAAKYSTNRAAVQEAMKKTRLIVDMGGATNVGDSIYLAVPQYRGISYSWWEGDTIGTEEQKLPPYASFDPSKTYTVKVTLTANDGLSFPTTPEVTAAKWLWKDKDLEFAITRDKLTMDAEKKTITFELHLFKQLALTLPTLHPGDEIFSNSEVGGVPSGMYVRAISWRDPKPSGYAGAAGTEYTILELALKTDGDCLPMIPTVTDTTADPVSCTVNGKPYTCTIIADRGLVCIKDVKVPVVPEGVTVSGTVKSWNATDDALYYLYPSTMEDADIKAEWKSGGYTGTACTSKGTPAASGNQFAQTFQFDTVAEGDYKLAIFKPGKYVPKIVPITVGSTDHDCGQLKLWLYGDVNYDGKVSVIDATQTQRYAAGKSSKFTEGTLQDIEDRKLAANVTEPKNHDNRIDVVDATQIQRYIAGKTSTFESMK